MNNPTIAAILDYTDDPNQQLAMGVGSHLEGGWSAPFPPGDHGTSFGPYQIHLPAHPGVTAAEANDPVWSTSYMGPAYRSGVKKFMALFSSDPEAGAERAAAAAERPAQDYVAGRGKPTVDAAFAATMNALPPTSAAALVQGATGDPGLDQLIRGSAAGAAGVINSERGALGAGGSLTAGGLGAGAVDEVNKLLDKINPANAIAAALGVIWDDVKPFVVTMGFAGLGLALVLAGLVISTRGARDRITSSIPPVVPV